MSLFSRIFGKPPADAEGGASSDAAAPADGQGAAAPEGAMSPGAMPAAAPDPFAEPSPTPLGGPTAPVDPRFAHWGGQAGEESADPVPPVRNYTVEPTRTATEPPRRNTPSPTRLHQSNAPPGGASGPHPHLPPADALPSIIVDVPVDDAKDRAEPPRPPSRTMNQVSAPPPLPPRAGGMAQPAVGPGAPAPPKPFAKTQPLSPSRPGMPAVSPSRPGMAAVAPTTANATGLSKAGAPAPPPPKSTPSSSTVVAATPATMLAKATGSSPGMAAVKGPAPPRTSGAIPAVATSAAAAADASATPASAPSPQSADASSGAKLPLTKHRATLQGFPAPIKDGAPSSEPSVVTSAAPPDSGRSVVMNPDELQAAMAARRAQAEPPPAGAVSGAIPDDPDVPPPAPSSSVMDVMDHELDRDDDTGGETGGDDAPTMVLSRAPKISITTEIEMGPLAPDRPAATHVDPTSVPSFVVDDIDAAIPPLSDAPSSRVDKDDDDDIGVTASDAADARPIPTPLPTDDLPWPSSAEWRAATPVPPEPDLEGEKSLAVVAVVAPPATNAEPPISPAPPSSAITRPPEPTALLVSPPADATALDDDGLDRMTDPPETPAVEVPILPTPSFPKVVPIFDGAALEDVVRTTEERFEALTDPLHGNHTDVVTPINDDARALFVALARLSAKHVRAFVFDLVHGPASADWLPLTSACCGALRAGADQFELHELGQLVGDFGAIVDRAADRGLPTIDGDARDAILAAFDRLAEKWSDVFSLAEGEDPGREGIVVRSLLSQVEDVHKVTQAKLFAAGLMTLDGLLAARPSDLVETSGIDLEAATKIVARLAEYQRELTERTASGDELRWDVERLRTSLAELVRHHDAFERAFQSGDSATKKEARKARERALLGVRIAVARAGAGEVLIALERAAFGEKIASVQAWLAARDGSEGGRDG